MISNAVVLLSGGLDSTAALAWALHRYTDVRCLGVDYGQPNRDAELASAKRSAGELGAPYAGIAVADALLPSRPGGLLSGKTSGVDGGVARAFVPGRNLLFATVAAAHACTWWAEAFDIVIGAVAEDQDTFPDCRPMVLAPFAEALGLGCSRSIRIMTPWASKTKRDILYALQPDAKAYDIVRRSWSCYERTGPCGKCGACEKRAAAFSALGVVRACTREAIPLCARVDGEPPARGLRLRRRLGRLRPDGLER